MIIGAWAQSLFQHLGGSLPVDYCCVDLESTGFNRKDDLIVEVGHCLVYDSKIEKRYNVALNWVDHPDVPNDWLEKRLKRVKSQMEASDQSWHIDMDYLKTQGLKPEKVLNFYHDFLTTLMENQTFLVLHNGFSFDEPMFRNSFRDFLGVPDFSFGEDHVLDTSALVKASQLVEEPGIMPTSSESARGYFQRIHGRRRKGVRSNLNFCVERFGLINKYGLDPTQLHQAGEDAYVCHLLVEEMREFLKPKQPKVPAILREHKPRKVAPARVKPKGHAGSKTKPVRRVRGGRE